MLERIRNRIAAETAQARALGDATDAERGRWLRRLSLFAAALMALLLVQSLIDPIFPDWFRLFVAAMLVITLGQAAVAPWFARHSRGRRRD